MLAAIAIAGSLVGGYTSWHLGRKGGEAALRNSMKPRLLERIRGWMERHPVLAVFVPAILPPPIPLSPFLLAAGALGIPFGRFLAVFGAARTLRYGAIAFIAVRYGRRVLRLWSSTLDRWSIPVLCVFGAVVVAGALVAFFKLRKRGKSGSDVARPAGEAAAG
jgi:membrane protein DedA with SNARE-associated domain